MKPPEFRNMLLVMWEIPYIVVEGRYGNLSSSGTLSIGSVVWIGPGEKQKEVPHVMGYAERIGRISISWDDLAMAHYSALRGRKHVDPN
jgi:hypothetical protein